MVKRENFMGRLDDYILEIGKRRWKTVNFNDMQGNLIEQNSCMEGYNLHVFTILEPVID